LEPGLEVLLDVGGQDVTQQRARVEQLLELHEPSLAVQDRPRSPAAPLEAPDHLIHGLAQRQRRHVAVVALRVAPLAHRLLVELGLGARATPRPARALRTDLHLRPEPRAGRDLANLDSHRRARSWAPGGAPGNLE